MILRDLNNLLLKRFSGLKVDNADHRERGISALNISIAAIWRSANWPFRKRLGQITLIPRYTTGTASFTKYDGTNDAVSMQVDFSGATLTQSMVGRFFKPNKSSIFYKIIAISGNSAFLNTQIADSSSGNSTFEIWKRFYYLPSDVDFVLDGFNWDNGVSIEGRSDTRLTYDGTNIGNEGNPEFFGDFGIDAYDDIVYNTGSISAPANSNTITGNGTSFLGNVFTGDILKVNTKEYYVKRVESNTSIILYNYVSDIIAAGSSYEIRKNHPIGIQVYPANDAYRVIDFTYLNKPYEIKNEDYDLFPFDFDYVKATLDRAQAIIEKDLKIIEWKETLNIYSLELDELIDKKKAVRMKYTQFYPTIPNIAYGRENG